MSPITFIEQRIFSSFFQYCAHHLRGDGSAASVNFRRLWFSNGLNCFGAQITSLALPLCAVLLLHATPEQMGVLVALQALPFALFGLPVGVLLDRRSKHPIMLFSESMSGLALASVAVAYWCGVLSMPWLYIVGFIIGTGFVVGGGAEQVFLTFLVGRMTSTMRFLTVATAPLGALAAGWVAEHFGVRNGLVCIAAGSIALTIAMVWGTPLRSVRT